MPDRREFLALGAAGLAALAAGRGRAAPARPPNIVYILADDLGYGDVHCLNPDGRIPTPHLDRLAGQSRVFTDAHSGSAVCTPTRYGLLTGRYCWRSRSKTGVLGPYAPPLIPRDRLTVPALLKRHGYATACIGKWHLGWTWPRTNGEPDFGRPIADGPTTLGFDRYFGTDVPNYPPYCFIDNDHTVGLPSVPKPKSLHGNPGLMLPGWQLEAILPTLARKATEFIDERAKAGGPFCLYLPLTAPHTPIAPSREFVGRTTIGKYGDLVAEVDWVVGEVLAALERHQLADDTIVIFTSDNGFAPYVGVVSGDDTGPGTGGVAAIEARGHRPSHVFRGYKSDAWDGGHHVPFFLRWPGHVPAGTTSPEVICHTDLLATLAALLGDTLPDNAGEDSVNVLPAWLGAKYDGPLREATVHHGINGLLAIRQGRWKLILGPGSGGWSKTPPPPAGEQLPPVQLYDLAADVGERRNLWAEQPEVVQRLTALLTRYVRDGRSTPGTRQTNEGVAWSPQTGWARGRTGAAPLDPG